MAEQNDSVRAALAELVRVLRGYGSFPADLLPPILAAERALAAADTSGVAIPRGGDHAA